VADTEWRVSCEPKEERRGSDGENIGGMVIYLTNGSEKEEFSRVAFARRNSKHKTSTFKSKLREEIEQATAAVETLNTILGNAPKVGLQ